MNLKITQTFLTVTQEEYNKWYRDRAYMPKSAGVPRMVNKTYKDAKVLPRQGDRISSSLWERKFAEQEIVNVTWDLDEDKYYIELPVYYIVKDSPWDKEFEAIVTEHGWTCGVTEESGGSA